MTIVKKNPRHDFSDRHLSPDNFYLPVNEAGPADAAGRKVVTGSAKSDTLSGTNGSDTIDGKAGNDTIKGLGGNDTLIGGAGNDTISGGAGNDVITDASGKNWLSGDGGNDQITGGKDADSFSFSANNLTFDDTVIGGEGSSQDRLLFTTSGKIAASAFAHVSSIEGIVLAKGGNTLVLTDALVGSAHSDVLKVTGSSGNDIINGGGVTTVGHNLIVSTGAGDDTIIAGAGDDTLDGGLGADSFRFFVNDLTHWTGSTLTFSDIVIGGEGSAQDRLIFTTSGTISASAFNNVSGIEEIVLDNGGNTLVLTDALVGSAYGDVLKVVGGSGNDVINAVNVVTAGHRLIVSAGNGDDTITAGAGNDKLSGGAGDDKLGGGVGDNTVSGGSGIDTAVFTGNAGGYSVYYGANGHLTIFKYGTQTLLDNTVELIKFGDTTVDRSHVGAPVVTSVTGVDGEVTPGSTTTDSTLVINGTSGAFARIAVYEGKVQIGVTVASADGKWSLDYTDFALSNGNHSFSASASYGDGMPSKAGAGVTFTIDAPSHVTDLGTLTANEGFVIHGSTTYFLGQSVSSAGDVNGDGFEDIIVGASGSSEGGRYAGAAYVIFGTASDFGRDVGAHQVINARTLTASQGFAILGGAGDPSGQAVSSAGDINGDGFDDLIVGGPYGDRRPSGDDSGQDAGQAYVIFGTASGFGSNVGGRSLLDLGTLTASQGFVIQGYAAGDLAGYSVSSAGDINGDGIDDLIVGAPLNGYGGHNATGEAYVIFGTTSGFGATVSGRQVIDLAELTTSQGFVIRGDAEGDMAGSSVSSAGDVNGDGFDDLIVCASRNKDGGYDGIQYGTNLPIRSTAGAAYVIFGTDAGFGGGVDVTYLNASWGFIIQGAGHEESVLRAVSSAGDINGDGLDDLIVGSFRDGKSYVVFGQASGFGQPSGDIWGRQVIDLAKLTSSEGFVIRGVSYAGNSVSSAGDINGDGFDDLIVGANPTDPYNGDAHAYVVFGAASGFGSDVGGRQVVDLSTMTASQGFTIKSGNFDMAGWSVSSAGDINGDGFDDLMVGAPGTYYHGQVGDAYVLYGGTFGGNTQPINLTGTSAAEILMGNAGKDILEGKGGADVYRSGAGNDRILIADADFRLIDAGSGKQDIVVFAGTGFTLDARNFSNTQLSGIEGFDLTQGNNTLKLAASDVFHFSTTGNGKFTGADSHNSLVVDGNSGDTLQLFDTGAVNADWVSAEVNRKLDGTGGGDYTFVNLVEDGTHRVLASIAVDHDVTLVL